MARDQQRTNSLNTHVIMAMTRCGGSRNVVAPRYLQQALLVAWRSVMVNVGDARRLYDGVQCADVNRHRHGNGGKQRIRHAKANHRPSSVRGVAAQASFINACSVVTRSKRRNSGESSGKQRGALSGA